MEKRSVRARRQCEEREDNVRNETSAATPAPAIYG